CHVMPRGCPESALGNDFANAPARLTTLQLHRILPACRFRAPPFRATTLRGAGVLSASAPCRGILSRDQKAGHAGECVVAFPNVFDRQGTRTLPPHFAPFSPPKGLVIHVQGVGYI